MRIVPKYNTLRKSILLYRKIRHRKGHGVHSPFVFKLITKVIEERCPYYIFNDIERIRKQLLQNEENITYPDKHHKGKHRTRSIAKITKSEAISVKQGGLLFRLANYFKAETILQIGSSVGISTLYLTAYNSKVKCVTLEKVKEYASISRWVYDKAPIDSNIELHTGEYKETLPKVLTELKKIDLIFINIPFEHAENEWIFDTCIPQLKNESIVIIRGIKSNKEMRSFWEMICKHPEVTVTIDLYSLGLVFFNKKLHKKKYKTYL